MKRFRERALDCSDAVDKETLVDVCLQDMANEYQVYLQNLTFPSFSKLVEAARRTNESVRNPSRPAINSHSGVAPRSFPRKRHVIAAIEDGREAKPPRSKKPYFRQGYKADNRQGKKSYPVLPTFPYGNKKAVALLNQWVKDETVTLPRMDQLPSEEDQQEPDFCPYHRRRGHNLEQCVVFRKIFDQKLEAGEILFQNGESQNLHAGHSQINAKEKERSR